MPLSSPYLRLMRLHQPVGIWLLLWPCWWALALASKGMPEPRLLILFALGAIIMRGAGCIINDMVDRDFDKHVERTKMRPLASSELTMRQAAMLLALLLIVSFFIAWMLGKIVVLWALLSLIPVAIYPWMKRISWWPQLFLGFTFNWGALMGWAAVRGTIEWPALALYAGGIFWTLGYDTLYAHQDRNDDTKIGIKSTARRLGESTKKTVAIFYMLAVILWMMAGSGGGFYVMLAVALGYLLWQVSRVKLDEQASCSKAFASNVVLGALVFIACLIA
jgi:4-hydroxybenzoate polyprenyltransferase